MNSQPLNAKGDEVFFFLIFKVVKTVHSSGLLN